MAFDFPDAPVSGDVFDAGGKQYAFDGEVWRIGDGGAAASEYVLKAGDTMTGALMLRSPDPVAALESTHKRYVDAAIAAESLYQGTWQVAANVPDITPSAAILNSYSWVAVTADPAVPELAPAGLPGIGGQTITEGNTVIWNEALAVYQLVRASSAPGDYLPLIGGTMTGPIAMGEGAGIHWGNLSAQTDAMNFSEGLCLYGYGSTSQFGFTITSGTLNYVVQNSGNHHVFRNGSGAENFKISNGACTLRGTLTVSNLATENYLQLSYGGGTPASQGAMIGWFNADDSRKAYIGWGSTTELVCQLDSATQFKIAGGDLVVQGNILVRDNDKLDLSNGYYIQKQVNFAKMFFHAGQNSGVFTFHITGFGDAYVIDKVGSVGNSVSGTSFIDRSLNDDPTLEPFLEGDDTPELKRRGVNLGRLLMHALERIAALEDEVAALKGGAPTPTVGTVNVVRPPPRRR